MLNYQKVNVSTYSSRIPTDSQVELVLNLPACCASTNYWYFWKYPLFKSLVAIQLKKITNISHWNSMTIDLVTKFI